MTRMTPLLLENAALDLAMGRFQSAQSGIETYLQQNRQDAQAYYWLGELYRQRKAQGDLEKAITQYHKAVSYDAQLPEPYKALGLIYYKRHSYAQARTNLEKYIQLAPEAGDRLRPPGDGGCGPL